MPRRASYLRTAVGLPEGRGALAAVRWLLMYVFGRVVLFRRLARWNGRRGRSSGAQGPSVFGPVPTAEVLKRLREDGVDATLRLPASTSHRLAAAASRLAKPTAFPPGGSCETSDADIDALGADPALLEIAEGYLGRCPRYAGCRVWWLDDASASQPLSSGTRFHYDLYDYGALAFLVFLTDVSDEAGAHSCVRGSHRRRSWRDQVRPTRHRSEAEVIAAYGAERVVTITGPAGTVIAEDPFCFHRARPPMGGRRLTLQFLYAARDFPMPSFRRITTAAGGPPAPDTGSAASRRESRKLAST